MAQSRLPHVSRKARQQQEARGSLRLQLLGPDLWLVMRSSVPWLEAAAADAQFPEEVDRRGVDFVLFVCLFGESDVCHVDFGF